MRRSTLFSECQNDKSSKFPNGKLGLPNVRLHYERLSVSFDMGHDYIWAPSVPDPGIGHEQALAYEAVLRLARTHGTRVERRYLRVWMNCGFDLQETARRVQRSVPAVSRGIHRLFERIRAQASKEPALKSYNARRNGSAPKLPRLGKRTV